jgi:hypothetical protein
MEFGTLCCEKLIVIYVFQSNTTNLLNQTWYSICFSHPVPHSGVKVCLGIKFHTLMPEDGWGWPIHVACSVGFNKFIALESSK